MTSGSLNSKDKNNLIMAAVLVSMVAMAVIFFKLSRMLPLLYMAVGIIAFEIFYVIPAFCDKFYKLYGIDAGSTKWIPFYNVISVFNKPMAIACMALFILTIISGYLAIGPMFWVTIKNIGTFTDVQTRALGWFIIFLLLWSFSIGIGYASAIKSINDMKSDFLNCSIPKSEVANYFLVLFPFIRCFALFNAVNTANVLLKAGFEYGKDYTALLLDEEETNE